MAFIGDEATLAPTLDERLGTAVSEAFQSTRRPRADLRLGARAIDVLNKATQPPLGAFGSDCRRCSHANTPFCRRESRMAAMRENLDVHA
jgi:hypothetical protein